MKLLKKAALLGCLSLIISKAEAQKVTIAKGGQAKLIELKSCEESSFVSNGVHYFFTSYSEHAVRTFNMQSFDANGSFISDSKLEVNVGVFNNSYGIDEIAGLSTKPYALVEHLDKPANKNTLTAREISKTGEVATEEVELMSFPFEKTMNSGFNYSSVSADGNTLAVVGELPYNKELPAQFKVAIYDKDLKKIKEGEISFPGENTKNKSISIKVGNDGTVYIIRKGMTKKGEITLAAYQWQGTAPNEVKEYLLELTPPSQIFNYSVEVSKTNELVISGFFNERKTFSAGDPKATGVFFFTNKNKSEKIFKTFNLDAPVDNLTARKVLCNGSTIFLVGEQYKEERITPPASSAGSMSSLDYNYTYTHKSEFVIGLDVEGNKKFQLELQKDFSAQNFDKMFYGAYYICNDKLTLIYNDQSKKYLKSNESHSTYQIAVMVQITNDGLMQSPVLFKDDLKLDQYYVLNPSRSVQDASNKLSFLMQYNQISKYVSLKID